MLRDDHREKRLFQWVSLALERAEAVLEDVQVLRSEGHKPALGQLGGECFVVMIVFFANDALGAALEPVLAHDHRSPLAVLDVPRETEDPVGDEIREHVEHHFVVGDRVALHHLARADVRRQQLLVEMSDDLVPELVAVMLDRLLVFGDRPGVELRHVVLANPLALAQYQLRVAVDFAHLAF